MSNTKEAPSGSCCGPQREVAAPLFNRAGLSSLSYRIGTHATFLDRMVGRLSTQEVADGPQASARPLAALATRDRTDPTIALLDAWAAAADVLTFYQERIANEGYLRTATERRSILELARATGYELSPGVAAATLLSFTVEDAPGADRVLTVQEGTRVQSVPPAGKLPQTFETVEAIEARAVWNRLRPRATKPQPIYQGMTRLYLEGVNTKLQPGDAILIVGDERVDSDTSVRWDFRVLDEVRADPEAGRTLVAWKKELGGIRHRATEHHPHVYALRQRAGFFGANAPDWNSLPQSYRNEYPGPTGGGWDRSDWLRFAVPDGDTIELDAAYPRVLPGSWIVLTPNATVAQAFQVVEATTGNIVGFGLSTRATRLKLDEPLNSFPWTRNLSRRSTLVWVESEELAVAELPAVTLQSGAAFLDDPVRGGTVTLDRLVDVLPAGRILILTGRRVRLRAMAGPLTLVPDDGGPNRTVAEREILLALEAPASAGADQLTWHVRNADGMEGTITTREGNLRAVPAGKEDEVVAESATLAQTWAEGGRTVLSFTEPLRHWYDPASSAILANTARATHGERVEEVLGSGDASRAYQRFTLKRTPMTYVSSPTAGGASSTLELRVNGVKWDEAPSLYDASPGSRGFVVRLDESGKSTVISGDGEHGARLPSGEANVTAIYRTGLGSDGNVEAGRLTLLQVRPAGIREVTNPLPATGGTGPESLEQARTNAPLRVLTLDRIVSRQDYEDFARSFSGVGQARADEVWAGQTRTVHVTVGGSEGEPIPQDSQVYRSLVEAMKQLGDPTREVRVSSYARRPFAVSASLVLDTPRYSPDAVMEDVKRRLREAFGYRGRRFGQPVTFAEVLMVMQGAPGVLAVENLRVSAVAAASGASGSAGASSAGASGPAAGSAGGQAVLLNAEGARWDHGLIRPAEMLLIDLDRITLSRR